MKRLVVLAALALLAACGEKKAAKSDDQRTASGQILPGSVSDSMIAYDALTSQAPIQPRAAAAAPVAAASSAAEEAAPVEAGSPAAE
jgi:hypothetical protein